MCKGPTGALASRAGGANNRLRERPLVPAPAEIYRVSFRTNVLILVDLFDGSGVHKTSDCHPTLFSESGMVRRPDLVESMVDSTRFLAVYIVKAIA